MRDKKHEHHKGKGRVMPGFDNHNRPRGAGRKKKGGAWRFYDPAKSQPNPFEPHLRRVARTLALPGKHVRMVEEPVRSTHGK